MKQVVALAFAFGLSGCAGSPLGDAIAGPEKLAQQDDDYCRSVGTKMGMPEYANCRMALMQDREINHAAHRAASFALIATGAQIIDNSQTAPPPYQTMPVAQSPVRCRSTPIGNTVQTVCQ